MDIVSILVSKTIVYAIPLLLGALAGMFSERSGIINIALEGIMVFGSLFAALFLTRGIMDSTLAATHPQFVVFLAILVAGISGGVYSLIFGFAAIKLKANQVISGTALNIFAPAFAILLAYSVISLGVSSIRLPRGIVMSPEIFGLTIDSMPRWVYTMFFSSLYLTTPISIIILIIAYITLYKTKFGLRLRACGEHPQAADSVGIKVVRMRYIGVFISGILAGIGGFAFAMANGSNHEPDVLGYGFLALAVMIFGNWKPFKILFGALFFSLFKTIAVFASTLSFLPSFGLVKVDNLYKTLPYIITLIVLAFTSKKSRAPKAEGIPYDPGQR
ncbi:MAG: ABC transporter permease [Candidatus Izemoplasmatales bacterium]